MNSNLAAPAQSGHSSPVKPFTKLLTSLFVFNLFIVFEVIAHNETWPHASPLPPSKFLTTSPSKYPELMTISEFNDDFSFAACNESFDSEVGDEFFILGKFSGDVAQVLNGEFFVSGDEDYVALNSE